MKAAIQETVKSETQVIEYNIEQAVIDALNTKYADIEEIKTPEDYEMVMGGLREYRELRLKIDATHKELKKDALAYTRAVDAEKRRLRDLIDPGENKLKTIRKAEDDKKEAIEKARVDAIQNKIHEIRAMEMGLTKLSSAEIKNRYDELKSRPVTEEEFEELVAQAMTTVHNTLINIDLAYRNKQHEEELEIKRKEEEARLEKQRQEQEEIQKKIDEQNRILAEQQQKIDEEKVRLEAEKQAEETRKREEQIAKQAAEKAKQEEKERQEREQLEKIETERKAKAEKERQEALKPDKDKIQDITKYLLRHPMPEVKSDGAQQLLIWIEEQVNLLTNVIIKRLDTL